MASSDGMAARRRAACSRCARRAVCLSGAFLQCICTRRDVRVLVQSLPHVARSRAFGARQAALAARLLAGRVTAAVFGSSRRGCVCRGSSAGVVLLTRAACAPPSPRPVEWVVSLPRSSRVTWAPTFSRRYAWPRGTTARCGDAARQLSAVRPPLPPRRARSVKSCETVSAC